jgi:UDP-2,4-diacetamido-2,4,6-trideoxy-beta-L-altropyranose hydrolase
MMRVLFRADASVRIGTGHVMRCLALAAELRRRGCQCVFAMRPLPGWLGDLVAQQRFDVIAMGDGDDAAGWPTVQRDHLQQQSDARQMQDALAAAGADRTWDWIVADHYALGAVWHALVGPAAHRLLVIDDLADRTLQGNLLLDQNPQSPDRYRNLIPPSMATLLGPAHALLREEFYGLSERRANRPADQAPCVLISFGGVDEEGVALDALAALESCGFALGGVTLIAGARNPHLARLQAECARLGYECVDFTAEIAGYMMRADVAIGAGGTTMLERFAAGLPAVVVPIADNQRPGSLAAEAAQAITLVDVPAHVRVASLAQAVGRLLSDPGLRRGMGEAAARLCDGRGARRVAHILQREALALRPAGAADGDALHAWRNATETRRYSGTPKVIGLAEHRAWLAAVLSDPQRRLWIGELAAGPIGVVRLDARETAEGLDAAISVYLVPGRQGQGWGTALIDAAVQEARRAWPGLGRIDARISPDNVASQRAFAACGFAPGSDPGVFHLLLRGGTA